MDPTDGSHFDARGVPLLVPLWLLLRQPVPHYPCKHREPAVALTHQKSAECKFPGGGLRESECVARLSEAAYDVVAMFGAAGFQVQEDFCVLYVETCGDAFMGYV